MKKILLSLMFVGLSVFTFGQNKYFTKNGKVFFSATSAVESIEATNDKATSILDVATGSMDFAILMKAFSFERALMQEHFNENYVESDKFPKATFKGTVTDMSSVKLDKDGTYNVKIKGMLTIHGVSKEVEAPGTLVVKGRQITQGKSEFNIKLADYKISIPSLAKDKISEDVKITVDVAYQLYKS